MNEILGKILVCASLAAALALAVPLTHMTVSVMHGESPRQLAEQETEQAGEPAEEESADDEPQRPSFPYPKPVVQPDPGPLEETEVSPEEPAKEPAKEPVKKAKAAAARRSATAGPETKAPVQTPPAAQSVKESAEPENVLPKAALTPDEAPCMVDGLDGFSYDY